MLHKNLLVLFKPSKKTSQEDGPNGPVPRLMSVHSSLVSWSFFSPPPSRGSFGAPLPRYPQPGGLPWRQEAPAWPVPELSHPADHLHEGPESSYTRGLAQLSHEMLGFLDFSPASWINKGKDVVSLCWMPSWWLWNNTTQWNSVIFLADFFFFKFWCKMTLLSKIVWENFNSWRILVLIPVSRA